MASVLASDPNYDHYDIKGIPPPQGLPNKTVNIPYVPGTPARLNIEALASDKKYRDQWTLFVLGLEKFKARPVREKLSYFRIAGIHMQPAQPWDGADKPGAGTPDGHSVGGYCFHNALNFPTFHRPYMLVFEQLVWENMKEVVKEWIDKRLLFGYAEEKRWRDAADAWRLPYWDWAAKQSYVDNFACPEVITLPTVRIFPPPGAKLLYPQPDKYPNPFWDYENPEKDDDGNPLPFGSMPAHVKDFNIPPDDDIPWDKTSGTSRYGLTKENPALRTRAGGFEPKFHGLKGVNNVWQVNSILSSMSRVNQWYTPRKSDPDGPERDDDDKDKDGDFNGPGTFADAVSRMLSDGYHSSYEQFATTKWYASKETETVSGYLSLEYIHNNVHNLTGGGYWKTGMGNMADVGVAAFDPVFWLHHCNVDRLFAIWQALNWQKWWDASAKPDHPAEFPTDNRTSPLEPFHFKDGRGNVQTYASDTCRDWTKLGYTYDDLDNAVSAAVLDGSGRLREPLYVAALRRNLNALYPSTSHVVNAIRLSHRPSLVPGLDNPADFYAPGAGQWQDYIINISYDRYALGGKAYSIDFHLGGHKDDPATIWTPRNFVGKVYTFSSALTESCANCSTQQEEGVLSRAQVPLTLHLLHHVIDSGHHLGSFVQDEVEVYIRENLHWRFIALGGEEIPAEKFHKTKVEILVGKGEVEKPDEPLAKFGGYNSLLKTPHGGSNLIRA